MYKMYTYITKTWGKNGVEAIYYDGKIWINQKQLGNALAHSNIVPGINIILQNTKEKGMKYKIMKIVSLAECF